MTLAVWDIKRVDNISIPCIVRVSHSLRRKESKSKDSWFDNGDSMNLIIFFGVFYRKFGLTLGLVGIYQLLLLLVDNSIHRTRGPVKWRRFRPPSNKGDLDLLTYAMTEALLPYRSILWYILNRWTGSLWQKSDVVLRPLWELV